MAVSKAGDGPPKRRSGKAAAAKGAGKASTPAAPKPPSADDDKAGDVTYMATDEYLLLLDRVFGAGAQSRLSRLIGISRTQLNRYAAGFKIPKQTAMVLRLMDIVRSQGIPFPEVEALPPSASARDPLEPAPAVGRPRRDKIKE